MKPDFYISGKTPPQDFDGFPLPDPRPKDWREKAWVWVVNRGKTLGARVQGHAFAKQIVDALINSKGTAQ